MTHVELPEWAEQIWEPHWRYFSIHGGRGSAKSHSVASALLLRAAEKRLRIGCFREFQNSLNESVHALLKDKIEAHELRSFYRPYESSIAGANGSLFIYGGLRNNVHSVKSLEGLDLVWVEEGQRVSDVSWRTLIPTIRRPGSQIIITWNPEEEESATYQRFVTNRPDNCLDIEVNHDRNPWFPDVLREEMERDYATDPDMADHVWGGQTLKYTNAQVLRGRYRIDSFESKQEWHGPYYGADWGFSVDPTVLIRCWVSGRTLFVEHEAYGVGVDIEDTPKLFKTVPGADKHTIRADSARPETISHMRRHGFPQILGVSKRPGSVDDGVEHLRSYETIVIHPRCANTAKEARLWSFKTDKLSGDVLPVLLDKHDHCWDAIRYALEPIIRAGRPGAPPPKPPPKKPDYREKDDRNYDAWKTV